MLAMSRTILGAFHFSLLPHTSPKVNLKIPIPDKGSETYCQN